ncbi:hypothetical protein [Caldimonas brevitalea]|uniref:Uncharacterized protein n=1 Tax=Caldimonas brevitalea TaxID=413882 RepID=A0A0G3BR83_9BURK|nr:hypothetical protein [Caldimonas brevitalea]AKJ31934.1 hypothetical protein AAW51_5243 [Caldimonas brevitalea]
MGRFGLIELEETREQIHHAFMFRSMSSGYRPGRQWLMVPLLMAVLARYFPFGLQADISPCNQGPAHWVVFGIKACPSSSIA